MLMIVVIVWVALLLAMTLGLCRASALGDTIATGETSWPRS